MEFPIGELAFVEFHFRWELKVAELTQLAIALEGVSPGIQWSQTLPTVGLEANFWEPLYLDAETCWNHGFCRSSSNQHRTSLQICVWKACFAAVLLQHRVSDADGIAKFDPAEVPPKLDHWKQSCFPGTHKHQGINTIWGLSDFFTADHGRTSILTKYNHCLSVTVYEAINWISVAHLPEHKCGNKNTLSNPEQNPNWIWLYSPKRINFGILYPLAYRIYSPLILHNYPSQK
jgi:hypothetical protein